MGKRSRRRARPELPAPPARQPTPTSPRSPRLDAERSLLNAIADGELDDHLHALADAVDARRRLLHTVKAASALAALCIGDDVRINHSARPKYLRGAHGRVVEIDEDTVTVCLHRPIGRFSSGHVRCPPLALDRLDPQPAAAAS
ncbi:MAG: hypothetical protein LC777_01980 [Actinobacteria bacterium]|nr:hypothetical protein [Actinomycetota bacterium]